MIFLVKNRPRRILRHRQDIRSDYYVDNNDYAGKLMNIFVNIDHAAGCLDKNTDVNGKTNLLKFLTSLLDDINERKSWSKTICERWVSEDANEQVNLSSKMREISATIFKDYSHSTKLSEINIQDDIRNIDEIPKNPSGKTLYSNLSD